MQHYITSLPSCISWCHWCHDQGYIFMPFLHEETASAPFPLILWPCISKYRPGVTDHQNIEQHISSFQATLSPNLIIIRIAVLNTCLVLWPEWLEIYMYMELKRNRLTANFIWRKAIFFMEFSKVHANNIQCKLPLQNLQNFKNTKHLIQQVNWTVANCQHQRRWWA